jgi:uncharacterized protein (DUF111 family)
MRTVETPFGPIAVKTAFLGGELVQASPEFRDCEGAARRLGVPLKEVYAAATAAFREVEKGGVSRQGTGRTDADSEGERP